MGDSVTVKCKAILFDMDGTLVDSTQVVEHAWGWWAARHHIPIEDVLSYSHGRPSIATLEHFLPGRDHSAEEAELAHYEETHTDGILAVPGAIEVVASLRGSKWAIVTSAWRALAETRVTGAGMPLPEVIVPVDEISKGKPDPEGYLKAAQLLGVAPEECLVFEDTRPGIDAGLRAGMQVVGILTTVPAEQLDHELLIRTFQDVQIRRDGDFLKVSIHAS